MDQRTEFDLVADFAALFPVEVISAMLGVPAPDRQQIRHQVDAMLYRAAGSAQYQGRFTTEDVPLESATIPAGSPTLLLTGSATRDPRAFARADEFDITRGAHAALAFGHGIHTCLGAWRARLESRVAFEEIRRRWPGFHVVLESGARVNMANVAGYSNLPFFTQ